MAHPFYTIVLIILLASSISGCYLYLGDSTYSTHQIRLPFIIFHIICIILLVNSFKNYDRIIVSGVIKVPIFVENVLIFIFLLLGIIAISVSLPSVNIYNMLFASEDLRHLLEEDRDISYWAFFGMKYWTIPLVLAFYNIIYYPNRTILILLLIFASLSTVVDGMIVAAREYLIKYIFVFAILYYWLKDFINVKWKKRLTFSAVFLGSISIVFFLLITIARFGVNSSQDTTVLYSVFSYLGQGFVNFSDYCHNLPNGRSIGGSAKFPFFAGYPVATESVDMRTNVFATCIGSWVSDLGILWAFIITLIYSLLFRIIGKLRINLFTLIYFSWAVEFAFSIIFFHNDVLNGSRVISLFLIILFDIVLRNIKK